MTNCNDDIVDNDESSTSNAQKAYLESNNSKKQLFLMCFGLAEEGIPVFDLNNAHQRVAGGTCTKYYLLPYSFAPSYLSVKNGASYPLKSLVPKIYQECCHYVQFLHMSILLSVTMIIVE